MLILQASARYLQGACLRFLKPIEVELGNHRPLIRAQSDRQVQRGPTRPGLLGPLSLDEAVATADAMHTQVQTVQWIIARRGHYLRTARGTRRPCTATPKELPQKDVPAVSWAERSHRRKVPRTVKVLDALVWIDFPAAAQVGPGSAYPHRQRKEACRDGLPRADPCPWNMA